MSTPEFGNMILTFLVLLCSLLLHTTTLEDTHCRENDIMKMLRKNKPSYAEKMELKEAIWTPRSLLQSLTNCSVYHGNIKIDRDSSVDIGFQEFIRYQDLYHLKNLREIYGMVHLNFEKYPEIKSLSFFQSLRKIQIQEGGFSLINSQVEMIDFRDIRLNVAAIGIINNRDLCYLENFRTINSSSKFTIMANKDPEICSLQGNVCSNLCVPSDGCWGPGVRHCFQSQYWRLQPRIARRSPDLERERRQSTPGRGLTEQCPYHEFFDKSKKQCVSCSRSCFGDSYNNRTKVMVPACSGTGNETGTGGCSFGCSGTGVLTITSGGMFECSTSVSACNPDEQSNGSSGVLWFFIVLLLIGMFALGFYLKRIIWYVRTKSWRRRLRSSIRRMSSRFTQRRSSHQEDHEDSVDLEAAGLLKIEDERKSINMIDTEKLFRWKKESFSLFSTFNISVNFPDPDENVHQVILGEQRQSMNYVFVGNTSSGKSMTINALLQMNLLRYGVGNTTLSSVWIEATQNTESYFEIRGSNERQQLDLTCEEGLDNFHTIVDNSCTNSSRWTDWPHVHVAKDDLKPESILSENVSILDTPGMGQNGFDLFEVKRNMNRADVLIFVVDITSLTNSGIVNTLKDEHFSVAPNVIFAVNKCDALNEEKKLNRRIRIKETIKDDICQLEKYSDISQDDIRKSIHFISSKTALKLMQMDNRRRCTEEEKEILEDFEVFKKAVVSVAQENRGKSKVERVQESVSGFFASLRLELKRIEFEVDDVKQCIDKAQREITASKGNLKHALNLEFVKELYYNKLKSLIEQSSETKILEFIRYCRSETTFSAIFDDVKQVLKVKTMDERINEYIDITLRRNIDGIINESEAPKFVQLFYESLSPREEISISKQIVLENKKEIKDLRSSFDRKYADYAKQCEEETNTITAENHDNQRKRLEKISSLENEKIQRKKKKSNSEKSERETGDHSNSGGSRFSRLSAAHSLTKIVIGKETPSDKQVLSRKIKQLKNEHEASTKKEEEKLDFEKKNMKENLKHARLSFKTEHDEKQKLLRKEIELNQAKIEECHSGYLESFNNLYVYAMERASENVLQSLRETVDELETMIQAGSKEITDLISSQ